MKVYEVRPDKGCQAHTEDSLESAVIAVKEWLSESDEGTELTVRVLEMSSEDYANLPEYHGP